MRKAIEQGKSGPGDIHMYFDCSDGGPDQLKRKNLIAAVTLDTITCLYFATRCFKHEGHLGVRQGVRVADRSLSDSGADFQYFSSVAKLINCWREDPASFLHASVKVCGVAMARDRCRKMPPRCLSGRWGSISQSEAYIMNFGADAASRCHLLTQIVGLAFASHLDKDKAPAEADIPVDAPHRELAVEDLKAHREKYGKWRRDTLNTVSKIMFHVTMEILHEARRPFDHLICFLSKRLTKEDIYQGRGHAAQLATGYAKAIAQEWGTIINDDERFVRNCNLLSSEPGDVRNNFVRFCFLAVLNQAASFDRRISAPMARPLT